MASIQKKDNGWQYRVSYKDTDGKYKTKTKGKFATKKEAHLAAAAIEKKLTEGFRISDADQEFPVYFREWYEVYRKGKFSKANDADIEKSIKFAEANFKGIKLKDLNRKIYQQKLNEFAKTRRSSTVSKIHIYMKAAIQDALQEGILFKDPTYKVSSRGGVSDKSDRDKFLSYNETKKLTNSLIDGIQPTYVSRYMILVGIATGMRYAEILGLTWNCIDFEDKTVRVEKTWDYVYKQDFSNTKNYQSMRLITIDDFTLDLLKQLKKHQREYYFGRILKNKKNLVFLNDDMELISNSAVNKTLKKHQKKIGIDQPINFHGLRHTHASILIYQGVNLKYVSRRLGHKKIETTLGIYQHILDEMEQKESQIVSTTMGELFA